VSVAETQARMSQDPEVKLIDVREDHEWEAAHAQGAIHLGKGIIERDIENTVPDKSTEMILYCGGGYRSALAADVLQRMGYTNVFSMAGGWKAWQEEGADVE
jgi:rhodanese-related sulfurtransferase